MAVPARCPLTSKSTVVALAARTRTARLALGGKVRRLMPTSHGSLSKARRSVTDEMATSDGAPAAAGGKANQPKSSSVRTGRIRENKRLFIDRYLGLPRCYSSAGEKETQKDESNAVGARCRQRAPPWLVVPALPVVRCHGG